MLKKQNLSISIALSLVFICATGCESVKPKEASSRFYYVAPSHAMASDKNPGTKDAPWKTLTRAGSAKELKPGDTVSIKGGVYREALIIKKSGTPEKPIIFKSAPGEVVEIRGSKRLPVTGWEQVQGKKDEEPYPNAFKRIWKIKLNDSILKYSRKGKEIVRKDIKAVYLNNKPLQMIGKDPLHKNDKYLKLNIIGDDYKDMFTNSFWFDRDKKELYVSVAGKPEWYCLEFASHTPLVILKQNDIVVDGIKFMNSGNTGGVINLCERVTIKNSSFTGNAYCGFGIYVSKNCTLLNCDLSWNGNTGANLQKVEDCVVDGCTITYNNWRHFHHGWHCGGMKNIGNKRTIIRNNVAAYNFNSQGIWFDIENEECVIVNNICHHNLGGIMYEINKKGGLIAGNLTFSNESRGIYVSGSSNTITAYNTSIGDGTGGIAIMSRGGGPWHAVNDSCLNNLVISEPFFNGNTQCSLILNLGKKNKGNISDNNYFANPRNGCPRLRPDWNTNYTLEKWRENYQQDLRSKHGIIEYKASPFGVRILNQDKLKQKLKFAGKVNFGPYKWRPKNPETVGCGIYQWPLGE